jgi:hypothetical protein
MRPDRRTVLLAFLAVTAIVAVVAYGPIPQDPAYHAFSDQRTLLGIPHFWNVVSNLPFALAGVIGLIVVARRPGGMVAGNAAAYAAFFAGAVLIAAGSAWYHLNPTNASLVWDRLPMTISLMAFFDVVIAEHVDARLARRALIPLNAIRIATAAWWGISDRLGAPDLRAYVIVQFLPMLLIPVILLLYPSRLGGVWVLWLILVFYGLAKAFELGDAAVHRVLGVISGHTLKHFAAAAGLFTLVWGLRHRSPAAV